ncbi:hypothetical protein [uncultured Duncaniella sp.]|uniref:hypothetical protein n=1 Tax=uncultured Duncaniella sp. TaxID=2768039 RepID=UPI00260CE998|nr:hypothetical protein [uncultured Duncaniella sp.]
MVIAFEGLDGCFKSTVCGLLKDTIEATHTGLLDSYSTYVKFQQFPRYRDESSYFVRQYLKEDLFDRKYCDPIKVVHPFYYLDRFAFWHEKTKSEVTDNVTTQQDIYDLGDPFKNIWIFDRYTWSSLTYQTAEQLIAEGFDIHQHGYLAEWVEKADDLMYKMYEVESSIMPNTDYVFWFWMPVDKLDDINASRKNAGPKDMNDNNVRLRNTIDWIIRRVVFGQDIAAVDEQEPFGSYCTDTKIYGLPHVIKFGSMIVPICVWDYDLNAPKSRMRILSEVMRSISVIIDTGIATIKANNSDFIAANKEDKGNEFIPKEGKGE